MAAMTREAITVQENATERLVRFGGKVNVLGALALGGAALVIPGPNVILSSWAVLNAAQAGGYELWRRHLKKRRLNRNRGATS